MLSHEDLQVEIELPRDMVLGDFVFATIRVRNTSKNDLKISSRINYYEGDLQLHVTYPNGERKEIRGTVVMESFPRDVVLRPGESVEGQVNLFYTNVGFTFDQPGTYSLQAKYYPAGATNAIVSTPVKLNILPATTDEERALAALTMNDRVGRSFAQGDAGADVETIDELKKIADQFPESNVGIVAQMVLGNTFAREFKESRTGKVVRKADQEAASQLFGKAFGAKDIVSVARLARAATLPRGTSREPLIDALEVDIDRGDSARGKDEEVGRARKILRDEAAA